MRRRFIAIVPEGLPENQDLVHLLSKLKRTLSERGKAVRWVAPSLWHITLAFVGEQEGEVEQLMESWTGPPRDLKLRLQGLGVFPDVYAARVLWIGVQAGQDFFDLQSHLTEHLRGGGLQLDDKPYQPHLTLARFRNPTGAADLLNLGGRKHFGDYRPHELVLFESVLEGGLIKYSPVYRRTLHT